MFPDRAEDQLLIIIISIFVIIIINIIIIIVIINIIIMLPQLIKLLPVRSLFMNLSEK